MSGIVGPELCLRYGEALRGPATEWRQSRGSCSDWKELRKKQPGYDACPMNRALGPRPRGLPGPIMGLMGRTALSWLSLWGRKNGCSSGKFFWRLNPVKMNHGRLAGVAVLTLSQSEQHEALLRREKLND